MTTKQRKLSGELRRITVSLEAELYDRLVAESRGRAVSLSAAVTDAIEDWLEDDDGPDLEDITSRIAEHHRRGERLKQ